MDVGETIAAYLEARRNANRSPGTIGLYRRQLADWVTWRSQQQLASDLTSVSPSEITRYCSFLRTRSHARDVRATLSPASQSSAYRAIRAFWKWAMRINPALPNCFAALEAPRVPRLPRKQATTDTLRKLLAACEADDRETSARNRALILLLYESGARIGELCSLTDGQLDVTRKRARVKGKGDKARTIFWGRAAGSALAAYLLVRSGPRGGLAPVFRGTSVRNKGGAVTTDAMRAMIKRLASANNIALPAGAPCHAFRHGFARRAITHGADISEVSKLLGHASIATTMLYLEGDEDELAATYDRIFNPSVSTPRRRSDAESHG